MPPTGKNSRDSVPRRLSGTGEPPGHPARTVASGSAESRDVMSGSVRVDGLLLTTPADARLDEGVDVTVEDGRGVARLLLRPQVLDHLVRVQDVGAHLVAPAAALALERVHLGPLLGLPDDQQPGLQDRKTSTRISFSGMSTWSVCSTTGSTSTPANEVCRRPWLSNGEMRTSRWVPCSTESVP